MHSVTKNTGAVPIDKLMLWRGSWTKYDNKLSNFFLRVHHDQLFLTADSKILESFNMHHKLKGIYKNDVLILIVNNSCKEVSLFENEIRKIKFQIKSNVAECLQLLGQYFPVVSYNSMQGHNVNAIYRNIDDILKHAFDCKDSATTSNIPPVFGNFFKICLLDPIFPDLVLEAEKIIKNEIEKPF